MDWQIDHDHDITMRDGVQLRADIYRHTDGAPRPAILVRTPYNKTTLGLDTLRPAQALDAGYAFVVQDTRGRFASEGDWRAISWDVEGPDGYDTVEWIAAQPWCDGNVGMIGPSYLGIVAWLTAMEQPPHLKAIAPAMSTSTEFDDFDTGGAFRLDHVLSWLAFMAADWLNRRIQAGDMPSMETITKIAQMALDPRIVVDELPIAENPWFDLEGFPLRLADVISGEIEATPVFDYSRVSVPTLSIGGFFDIFARGTVRQFDAVREQGGDAARDEHRLIIGPWLHAGVLPSYQGEMNFGLMAAGVISKLPEKHLQFFDRHLKGQGEPLPTIEYFMGGELAWRTTDAWPPVSSELALHLRSAGDAAAAGGQLTEEPAGDDEAADVYLSDPENPVPTHGGRVLYLGGLTPGPLSQNHLEARTDVCVYTGPVLEQTVRCAGNVRLLLHASTSGGDCDWYAKVLDVQPDGRAVLVTEGNLRARFREGYGAERPVEAGAVLEYDVDLGPLAWAFEPGHRIRLHLQSSNYPQLDRNLQTGGKVGTEAKGIVATQTIAHDAAHPSRLLLPILL